MELKIVNQATFTVIGMDIRTTPMSPEIPSLWPKFVARITEIEHQIEPNVSYGVMRHLDNGMTSLDYLAAVAVAASSRTPPGMVSLAIPAGMYAVFAFPLSGLAAGFGEIFDRAMPSSDYMQVSGPYFERYDESFDPGKPNSTIEVYLPVKPRTADV